MPYCSIKTNQSLDDQTELAILKKCSLAIAEMLGKPERYVMTDIESGTTMLFGGDEAPCAYLELKSLGLPEERSGEFSQALCELIGEQLNLPVERIYIEFASPARHMWGWNSTTFG